MTEQDLAARVVAGLEAQGATVYQEVTLHGQICDIVAVQGPIVHAVECKTSATLYLLGQAHRWLPYAHYVSIVAPATRQIWRAVEAFLKAYGIGWLWPATCGGPFHILVPPMLHRNIRSDLKDVLAEGHRRPVHALESHYGEVSPTGAKYTGYPHQRRRGGNRPSLCIGGLGTERIGKADPQWSYPATQK